MSAPDRVTDLAALAATLEAGVKSIVPLYAHMDLSVSLDEGVYRVHVPFHDALKSHVGTIHPAYQWAAGELLGGLVALHLFGNVNDIFLVVKKVDIELLRPAKGPIVAEAAFSRAQGEKLRQDVAAGEGTFTLDVELRRDEERVAHLVGHYLIRPRR